MTDPLTLDGYGLLPVRRPATVAELGTLIRDAKAAGQGVYPIGGGTTLDVGMPPIKPGIAVDLRGLANVIDYPARDMTITVQAGITVAAIRSALTKEGQRLPVDVPGSPSATLGGALALNQSGPRRLFRGTMRDYVIGMSFLTDDGTEVKGGGRVVKNVAGYDLMKLQIGAVGTLGIISQVTLKVTPTPEDQAFVAFGVNAAAVGPTLDRLHASASRPVAVELLNAAAAKLVSATSGVKLPEFEPWVLLVGFEEKSTTVSWQLSTLKEELKTAPVRDVSDVRGIACEPLWAAITEMQIRPESRFIWKVNVLPSRVAEFVSRVTADTPYGVHAHALSGIVWLHAPEEFDPASGANVSAMEHAAQAAGGTQVVRRCPTEWKSRLRVWGRPLGDRDLMRTVKRTVDPANVFNPGRFFGDI